MEPTMLNPGNKYRVIFQGPRMDIEMVARYAGKVDDKLYFDLRPHVGTPQILERDVIAVYAVHNDVPLSLPHIHTAEVRVL